jgi:3-oxoacyl-(acyl-carrier-protein) synthase
MDMSVYAQWAVVISGIGALIKLIWEYRKFNAAASKERTEAAAISAVQNAELIGEVKHVRESVDTLADAVKTGNAALMAQSEKLAVIAATQVLHEKRLDDHDKRFEKVEATR